MSLPHGSAPTSEGPGPVHGAPYRPPASADASTSLSDERTPAGTAPTPSNAASGGPFARPLLPGLWRSIGGVLPPGAGVNLARASLFFDGARIAGPILVLVGWAAFGTALLIALGGRIVSMVEAETEAAAGAAI